MAAIQDWPKNPENREAMGRNRQVFEPALFQDNCHAALGAGFELGSKERIAGDVFVETGEAAVFDKKTAASVRSV